jgi:hypothetical protein
MGMTGLPPSEFSLISPGTKNPGQVTSGGGNSGGIADLRPCLLFPMPLNYNNFLE